MENKSMIFSVCHQLTKKLITGTSYNYHVTFSACLKLYNENISDFAMALSLYGISNIEIIKEIDYQFDFVSFVKECDNDRIAFQNMERCINIALNYGLKKRDIYRSKQEKQFDYVSDNTAPLLVDRLKKEDREDIKQEIFLYLYSRIDDPDFIALPNLYKLLRAGDSVITNYAKKQMKTRNLVSFDLLMQNGFDIPTISDFEKCYSSLDDLIQSIVIQLPRIHRDLAESIIYSRYTKETKYGIEIKAKEKNLDEIAKEFNISLRTVKTIISEIKNVDKSKLAI